MYSCQITQEAGLKKLTIPINKTMFDLDYLFLPFNESSQQIAGYICV